MESLILGFGDLLFSGGIIGLILVCLIASAAVNMYGSIANTSMAKQKSKAEVASAEALKFKALAEAQASVFSAKEKEKDFAYSMLIRELAAKANLSQTDITDIIGNIHKETSSSSKDAARDVVSAILESPDEVSVEDFQELMFQEEEEF